MQNLKYSYRLYPNKEQSQKLNQFCGAQRWIWNYFLDLEKKEYENNKKFRFGHKNITDLPKMKKEIDWLSNAPSTSLQQTLRFLNETLMKGIRKKSGFPKFKKKKHHNGSFALTMVSSRSLSDNHFNMPKIGKINIKLHRELPSDFNSCTVIQKASKWFIVFTVKIKKQLKKKIIQKVVGIDLNSKELLVTSDAEVTNNPKFFARTKRKIASENRKLANMVNGSSNWKKQLLRLQGVYDHMTNQRSDLLHKISHKLVSNNDMICVEDLNIAGMSKFNGHMVQDAGWSQLLSMIEYKCDLEGKHFVKIDRWFPSTQMCHDCGSIVKKKLTERMHLCDCGCEISRDLNAAINIRNEGHRAGTALINACGDTPDGGNMNIVLSSHVSMKQETTESLVQW